MVISQHLTWRALLCGALLISGILEVCSQQSPEILKLNTSYLVVSGGCDTDDFKIIKGQLTVDPYSYEGPTIIGAIESDKSSTTFKPLVPFNQETPYTLLCDGEVLHFTVDKPQAYEAIDIVNIYPAVKEVPANILKWYIRFSRPVNPVKIYEHIHFLDQDGAAIDRSILNLKAPLLSDDGTLLTIWIEPGRQKRLLGPNRHLGSVFDPYENYTLKIDGSIKDMEGANMTSSVSHRFITTDADREQPSIDAWSVGSLQAHTLNPLTIAITEQVDYGSLIDAFGLYYQGHRVAGTLEYDSHGNTILFQPEENWQAGDYTISLEQQLEDLAGNNLMHLFDRPIKEESQETPQEFKLLVTCK